MRRSDPRHQTFHECSGAGPDAFFKCTAAPLDDRGGLEQRVRERKPRGTDRRVIETDDLEQVEQMGARLAALFAGVEPHRLDEEREGGGEVTGHHGSIGRKAGRSDVSRVGGHSRKRGLEVDALGAGVTDIAVGDAVADMPVIGGYTQYLCVDAARVVRCPQGLDPAEAVSMILSYTTAWQMLKRECSLQSGDWILVHAAGGAVGSALLDLGRHLGLRLRFGLTGQRIGRGEG
jgi:hypothetical protein